MLQVSQPPTHKSLVEMFGMQRELMKWYIKMEDLPEYPLDLTLRSNQKLLKDFAYRIIEELGEAHEQLTFAFNCISTNHADEAFIGLEAYNEELADAWHFMLETLIFSGMDEIWIENWTRQYVQEHPEFDGLFDAKNLLAGMLKVADFLNKKDGKPFPKSRNEFVVLGINEASEQPWNLGGRLLSTKTMEDHEVFLWNITRQITIAMNCLKSRAWHNSDQSEVKIIKYNALMMDSLMALVRLMVFTGKNEISIYNSYLIKNKTNHERKHLNK